MRKFTMNDFVIDSKGYCFLCLDVIPLQMSSIKSVPKESTVHSLQYLSRFLRMDMRKVFPDMENIPPQLLAKVKLSKLKGELCSKCANLNDFFSNDCRRLEKIELEVMSSLEHMYRRLIKEDRTGGGTDSKHNLADSMEESRHDWIDAKLDILKIIRKEAIEKCAAKFGETRPRVKVQNLTVKNIATLQNKCKHRLRMKLNRKYCKISNETTDKHSSSSQKRSAFTKYILPDGESNEHGSPVIQAIIKSELESFSDTCHDDDEDLDPAEDFEDTEAVIPPPKISAKLPNAVKSECSKNVRRQGHPIEGKQTSNAKEHIKTIIGQGSGQRRFRCKICAKESSNRGNLTRHIRIVHLKEKLFRCSICSRGFAVKQALQRHMHWHAGRKPYQCKLCSKGFTQNGHLTIHLRVHSGIRPYSCNKCEKAYLQRAHLTQHLRNYHKRK